MQGLKKLRLNRKMTQVELAQRMGVTQSMVAKWETGDSYPRGETLTRLANLLHCTIDELFGRGEPGEAEQDRA